MALRSFLAEHGVTQAALAQELGLTRQAVHLKLHGLRPWKGDEIAAVIAFCRRYDPCVTYEDLFGDPGEDVVEDLADVPEPAAAGGRA